MDWILAAVFLVGWCFLMFQSEMCRQPHYWRPMLYHGETPTTLIFLVGAALALPAAIALLVRDWKFAIVVYVASNIISALVLPIVKRFWDVVLIWLGRRINPGD